MSSTKDPKQFVPADECKKCGKTLKRLFGEYEDCPTCTPQATKPVDELRAEILTEFKQVHKLAPADYTENCTNVVMSTRALCGNCGKEFLTYSEMRRHINEAHPTLKAELLAKNTDFIQWLYMRDFGETLTTERLERAYKEYAANN